MSARQPARFALVGAVLAHLKHSLRAKRGWRRYIGPKRAAMLVVMAVLIGSAWQLRRAGYLDPQYLVQAAREEPLYVISSFLVFYAVSVLTTLPTLPFNLAAGYLWGPYWGGLMATLATTLGALGAFAISRSLFGQPLAQRMNHALAARIQSDFERQGWKILAFLRLNPVVPTGVLNYVLPLTSVSWATAAWTTFAFLLPPSIGVAYIGHELGTFVADGSARDLVRVVLSISAAVVVLSALKYGSSLLKGKGR